WKDELQAQKLYEWAFVAAQDGEASSSGLQEDG
ncbi:unnamed protein product, partial [marine sediment metagenome]